MVLNEVQPVGGCHEVDGGFGREARHSSRPDVLDLGRSPAQHRPQLNDGDRRKVYPSGIIVNYFYGRSSHGDIVSALTRLDQLLTYADALICRRPCAPVHPAVRHHG